MDTLADLIIVFFHDFVKVIFEFLRHMIPHLLVNSLDFDFNSSISFIFLLTSAILVSTATYAASPFGYVMSEEKNDLLACDTFCSINQKFTSSGTNCAKVHFSIQINTKIIISKSNCTFVC